MSIFQSMPRPTETYHTATYDRISEHHGFDGNGKTILITGGAGGVGFSMAKAFAKTGVARVAIISRSTTDQAKAKAELNAAYPSTQVLLYEASITEHSRMQKILRDLDTVDVLVLNAAVAHRRDKATAITTDEVQDAFNVNVVAAFNLTSAYLNMPPLASGRRKTVLNVSSAALQMAGGRVGYGPSKAAAAQVMQQFAVEQKPEEVKIVSFHPGAIYTPGVARYFPKNAPMGWEDIDLPAHFALWLAGPESDFLHGRHVWAQWDVDELIGLKDRLANEPNFLKVGLIL